VPDRSTGCAGSVRGQASQSRFASDFTESVCEMEPSYTASIGDLTQGKIPIKISLDDKKGFIGQRHVQSPINAAGDCQPYAGNA
jgi:hypothetical protein